MKLIIKNPVFWIMIYSLIATFIIVLLSIRISNHKCPEAKLPELQEKHLQVIKKINNAETINDIDSLFFILYGIKPTR